MSTEPKRYAVGNYVTDGLHGEWVRFTDWQATEAARLVAEKSLANKEAARSKYEATAYALLAECDALRAKIAAIPKP